MKFGSITNKMRPPPNMKLCNDSISRRPSSILESLSSSTTIIEANSLSELIINNI